LRPVDLASDRNLRNRLPYSGRNGVGCHSIKFGRIRSADLLTLNESEIVEKWETAYAATFTGPAFSVRGWYQTLYRDAFKGKRILDVGCGLAPDTVYFAQHGARVTFLDIVESNVRFVERVCRVKEISDVSFCWMRDLESLDQLTDNFDVIYCCGSFINAPLEVARLEAQALLRCLPVGGRWVELGYPKARWEREGRIMETEWGTKTHGGAPWMEWRDLSKLDYMFAPAAFDVVLNLEFHNSNFNWFDLIRRS